MRDDSEWTSACRLMANYQFPLNGFVEKCCDVFLAVSMCSTENHDSVFDG